MQRISVVILLFITAKLDMKTLHKYYPFRVALMHKVLRYFSKHVDLSVEKDRAEERGEEEN